MPWRIQAAQRSRDGQTIYFWEPQALIKKRFFR